MEREFYFFAAKISYGWVHFFTWINMALIPKFVTFVCVGNICRSPLAEFYCRHLASQSQCQNIQAINFDSAGINGGNLPLARRTRVFLESNGIDTLGFQSKKVSTEYFLEYDLIIVMESYLKSYILKYYFNHEDPAIKSKIANRIMLFGELADLPSKEIPDPYLESDMIYMNVVDQIQRGCHNIVAKWEKIRKKSWYKRQILQVRQILGYSIYE